MTPALSLPPQGITDGAVLLRAPGADDGDGPLPAFPDRVLRHAQRRGYGSSIARLLAEHAFALGVQRVAAYVNLGNVASERVLERAGFTREGMVRSMPVPNGTRVD